MEPNYLPSIQTFWKKRISIASLICRPKELRQIYKTRSAVLAGDTRRRLRENPVVPKTGNDSKALRTTLMLALFGYAAATHGATYQWQKDTLIPVGLEPQSETVLQMPEGISNYFPENQSAVAISEVDHRTLTIKPLTGETEQRLFLRGASGKMYIAKLSTKLRHVPLIEVQDSSLATTAAAIPATGGSSISSSYLLVQMIRNKPLPGFTVSPWTRQILEGDEFTITGEHVWSSVNMTGVVARVTRASGVSKSVRINPDSLQINIPAFGQMRLISADRWTLDNGADTAIAQLVFTKD